MISVKMDRKDVTASAVINHLSHFNEDAVVTIDGKYPCICVDTNRSRSVCHLLYSDAENLPPMKNADLIFFLKTLNADASVTARNLNSAEVKFVMTAYSDKTSVYIKTMKKSA